MPTLNEQFIHEKAWEFSNKVSTSHRISADMYIGKECYTTVTEIVRVAFIAGAKMANEEINANTK